MRKKKLIRYALILAGILALTIFLPLVIRAGSDLIVNRILRFQEEGTVETEAEILEEAEEGHSSFRLDGLSQTEYISFGEAGAENGMQNSAQAGGTPWENGSSPGREQAQKTNLDEKLQAYRESFHPVVKGTKSGLYEIFIGDREAAFITAVADYMFSVYGGSLQIDEIDIADFISNDENEAACQILVRAGDDMSYYYASYNKKHDFYSIYAYQE